MIRSKTFCAYYLSPLGWLKIQGTGPRLTAIDFVSKKGHGRSSTTARRAFRELDQYFQGKRKKFSLRLHPTGTMFQQQVWKVLRGISYGKSASYGEVAAQLGRPKSVRAVAGAIGKNRLAILIPCHRVIGSDGSLTGYAHGLGKKAWLLSHECGL